MQTADRLEVLHERVARLESRERRWRGLALLLVLGSLACVTSAMRGPPEKLDVSSLALKDAEGNTRAYLRLLEGQPWLSLYDTDGKGRLALCLDEHGEGVVHAFKPSGENVARWPIPAATR